MPTQDETMDAGVAPPLKPAFDPVLRVAASMRRCRRPWYIAGGWAIDLFLGRMTRDHEDIDVAVLRRDQERIQACLSGWDLVKMVQGRRAPWRPGEYLELPIHEIHARRNRGTFAQIELLLEEAEGDQWTFRRDSRIARPLAGIAMRTDSGVRFLAPEIALLYKAKEPGAKDEADFGLAHPKLGSERRKWLMDALEIVHPGHPWIRRL